MDDQQIVCYCSDVTRAQIVAAIQDGARTLADIRRATTACTRGNCKVSSPQKRCCSPEIMEILGQFGKE